MPKPNVLYHAISSKPYTMRSGIVSSLRGMLKDVSNMKWLEQNIDILYSPDGAEVVGYRYTFQYVFKDAIT